MVKKGWSVVAPFAHCDACPAVESVDHLLDTLACSAPDILVFVQQAQHQLSFKRKWNVAFAACALTLWHARNDRVFNSKVWTATYIRFYAANMLRLWSHRAHSQLARDDLQFWCQKITA